MSRGAPRLNVPTPHVLTRLTTVDLRPRPRASAPVRLGAGPPLGRPRPASSPASASSLPSPGRGPPDAPSASSASALASRTCGRNPGARGRPPSRVRTPPGERRRRGRRHETGRSRLDRSRSDRRRGACARRPPRSREPRGPHQLDDPLELPARALAFLTEPLRDLLRDFLRVVHRDPFLWHVWLDLSSVCTTACQGQPSSRQDSARRLWWVRRDDGVVTLGSHSPICTR